VRTRRSLPFARNYRWTQPKVRPGSRIRSPKRVPDSGLSRL
jgi:hypothetical protein